MVVGQAYVVRDGRITADEASIADVHRTVDDRARRDVAMVADPGIVLDQCLRVEDAVGADGGAGVHDHLMHDDRTVADRRMPGYRCSRRNDQREIEPQLQEPGVQRHSHRGGLDLPDRDQRMVAPSPDRGQIIIGPDDRVAQHFVAAPRGVAIDNARDLEAATRLNDIDA